MTRPLARMHRSALGAAVAILAAAAPASAAGRPDLAVTRLSAAATTGGCAADGCGVQLTASVRVVNRGARRAPRARLGFFLSLDARRDGADVAAGGRRVAAIRSGRRRSAQAALALTGVTPGTYRLIGCADVTRRVRERRERNNCRASGPFAVGAAGAPGAGPPPPSGPCREPGWRTDLCAELATAMANRTFFDMADAVTFALLYQHYRTGQAIPSSIAAGVIEPLRKAWDPVRGQAGISTYRVSGFLDFFVYSTYAGRRMAAVPGRPRHAGGVPQLVADLRDRPVHRTPERDQPPAQRHRRIRGRVAQRDGQLEGLRPAHHHRAAALGRHRVRPPHARRRPDRDQQRGERDQGAVIRSIS